MFNGRDSWSGMDYSLGIKVFEKSYKAEEFIKNYAKDGFITVTVNPPPPPPPSRSSPPPAHHSQSRPPTPPAAAPAPYSAVKAASLEWSPALQQSSIVASGQARPVLLLSAKFRDAFIKIQMFRNLHSFFVSQFFFSNSSSAMLSTRSLAPLCWWEPSPSKAWPSSLSSWSSGF